MTGAAMNYNQALDEVGKNGRISILFGNGLSRSWSDITFNYSTLFDVANFGKRHTEIQKIFEALNTQDFEKVTGRLHAASALVPLYIDDPQVTTLLDEDAEQIKKSLLAAIANTHPIRPKEITDKEYEFARTFFSLFANIYTVNYDLLMYWARNQDTVEPTGWRTDDGFRQDQIWIGPETAQNVYFLHGALHLYAGAEGVKKHAFSAGGEPIMDKLQENLQNDIFPLFVSEPTSDAKLSRITKNPYLSYCLRKLHQETDNLFIFGHNFAETDRHIFSAIEHSTVTRVYVSFLGDFDSHENRRIRANAGAWIQSKNRTVSFVDANTVPIWRGLP